MSISARDNHSMTSGYDPVLDDVIEEMANRLQAGEPVDGAAILAKYPDRADSIRRLLPAMEVMAEFGVSASRLAAAGVSPGLSPLTGELGTLGDFRILREVGRGGMGIVYEAEQLSLGRRVALKVLPFAGAMDPQHLRRFRTEAQAAAQLHHTNIVPVFWIGCENGVHYYAMQFIEGRTLADVVRELRQLEGKDRRVDTAGKGEAPADLAASALASALSREFPPPAAREDVPPPAAAPGPPGPSARRTPAPPSGSSTRNRAYFRNVARLGLEAAEALEHAHQEGIVHRDIKPANLMVDARGHLWVTDFGLARLQNDGGLTVTGDLLGTLRYMSPEQALGKRAFLDHRTDIYSLGATLYELLILEPAFGSRDRAEMLWRIVDEEPRSPRRLNETIPRELETIVLKAMAKEPAGRYQTAQELADDLRHFLEHRPIKARRPTLAERAAKWARRHRAIVVSAVLIVILAAMGLGASLALIARERTETVRQRVRNRHHRYAADIRQAHQLAQNGEGPKALALLRKYRPSPGEEDVREFAWYYLMRLCHGERRSFRGHQGAVYHADFSPDGRTLVSCGQDGTVRLWDVPTGRPLRTLSAPGRADDVNWAEFSPDGRALVTAGDDGKVRLWDVASGGLRQTIAAHQGDAGARFTPDGRRLISGGRKDGLIKLWDPAMPQPLASTRANEKALENLAFSPDGRTLATTGGDGYARLWNLADLSPKQSLLIQPGGLYGLAFSADGTRLALGDVGGDLTVWDLSSGERRKEFSGAEHTADIQSVAYVAGGRTIATAGGYAILKLWDAATGKHLGSLVGHTDKIWGISVSPDGTTLATASSDGTVKLWDAWQVRWERTLLPWKVGHDHGNMVFAFTPDGRTLIVARAIGREAIIPPDGSPDYTINADLEVRGFDPSTGTQRFHHVLGRGRATYGAHLSPGGAHVKFSFPDGTATIWEVATGKRLASLGRISSATWAWDPYLIIKRPHGPIELVDAASGETRLVLEGTAVAVYAASSPKGDVIALRQGDQLILWDVATNRAMRTRRVDRPAPSAAAFSPDGSLLAVGDSGGVIQVWDAMILEQRGALLGHSAVAIRSLAFSPDGRTLVSDSADGTMRLWDVVVGEELLTLRGPSRWGAFQARLSPDGRTLAFWAGDENEIALHLIPTALPADLESEGP